jgi:hypothetical protein
MVLVGMRDDESCELVAALDNESGIGEQDIDARGAVVAERDAAIEHEPLPLIAVEVEVHADLARAAEREKEELVRSFDHPALRS